MNARALPNKYITAKKAALTAALLVFALDAAAATTDLATSPLVTTPTTTVLPNVFLMLDDSGSMGWDYAG